MSFCETMTILTPFSTPLNKGQTDCLEQIPSCKEIFRNFCGPEVCYHVYRSLPPIRNPITSIL